MKKGRKEATGGGESGEGGRQRGAVAHDEDMARRGPVGQKSGGFVDPLRVDVGESDEPAMTREMPGRRAPDDRSAAGDEDRLSCHPAPSLHQCQRDKMRSRGKGQGTMARVV